MQIPDGYRLAQIFSSVDDRRRIAVATDDGEPIRPFEFCFDWTHYHSETTSGAALIVAMDSRRMYLARYCPLDRKVRPAVPMDDMAR